MYLLKGRLSRFALTGFMVLSGGSFASAASVCPTLAHTNTDCGFLITIGAGTSLAIAPVMGANAYDGSDDALVGIVNNSGAAYTGSFQLTGNGSGIFGFDGDGICTFTGAAYCSTAANNYQGPLNTFSNVTSTTDTGTVNVMGLAAGASTYFSLEGDPKSIVVNISPEPTTNLLLAGGLLLLGFFARRKGLPGRQ